MTDILIKETVHRFTRLKYKGELTDEMKEKIESAAGDWEELAELLGVSLKYIEVNTDEDSEYEVEEM